MNEYDPNAIGSLEYWATLLEDPTTDIDAHEGGLILLITPEGIKSAFRAEEAS